MEQIDLKKKTLTIAIPTWNRSKHLKRSLEYLLPQIEKHSDVVELIISDNFSSDDTVKVVNELLNRFCSINFKLIEQKSNTGFFGNFTECMMHSTGEYFWLLSDDDFLLNGVLDKIITYLSNEKIGAIFLKDWVSVYINSIELFPLFKTRDSYFKTDDPYRHSLISSVIHINKIKDNLHLFEKYKNNALIGYLLYMICVKEYDTFIELDGASLVTRTDTSSRFNGLSIFTYDLYDCITEIKQYYPQVIVSKIVNSFLETNIKLYYKEYKFSKIYKRNKNISFDLIKLYCGYINFWIYILPLILCPRKLFFLQRNLRRLQTYGFD